MYFPLSLNYSIATNCTPSVRDRHFQLQNCACQQLEKRQADREEANRWWNRWVLCATELVVPYNVKIIKKYGVTGSWTQGLVHAKHALYQLSYNPVMNTSTNFTKYRLLTLHNNFHNLRWWLIEKNWWKIIQKDYNRALPSCPQLSSCPNCIFRLKSSTIFGAMEMWLTFWDLIAVLVLVAGECILFMEPESWFSEVRVMALDHNESEFGYVVIVTAKLLEVLYCK